MRKKMIIVRVTEKQFETLKQHADTNAVTISKAVRGIIYDQLQPI